MKIKISGITSNDDALWAANCGVDYLTCSLATNDAQKISLQKYKEIVGQLPSYVTPCVVVDATTTLATLKKIVATSASHPVAIETLHTLSPDVIQALRAAHQPASIFFIRRCAPTEAFVLMDSLSCYDAVHLETQTVVTDIQRIIEQLPQNISVLCSYEAVITEQDEITAKATRERIAAYAPLVFAMDINSAIARTPRKKDFDKLHATVNVLRCLP